MFPHNFALGSTGTRKTFLYTVNVQHTQSKEACFLPQKFVSSSQGKTKQMLEEREEGKREE